MTVETAKKASGLIHLLEDLDTLLTDLNKNYNSRWYFYIDIGADPHHYHLPAGLRDAFKKAVIDEIKSINEQLKDL